MELRPVVFVMVLYACGEEGECGAPIMAGLCNEEEDLGDGAVEDLRLFFSGRGRCVVVTYGEEVFACGGFDSFSEVFGEFGDYVAGVFLYAEGNFAWVE